MHYEIWKSRGHCACHEQGFTKRERRHALKQSRRYRNLQITSPETLAMRMDIWNAIEAVLLLRREISSATPSRTWTGAGPSLLQIVWRHDLIPPDADVKEAVMQKITVSGAKQLLRLALVVHRDMQHKTLETFLETLKPDPEPEDALAQALSRGTAAAFNQGYREGRGGPDGL